MIVFYSIFTASIGNNMKYIGHKRIYMDYAASTPLDSAVEKAMRPYYARAFGNPSSSHLYGQTASRAVFLARQGIARALNADYSEIIFTGSATEANNLGVRGAFEIAMRDHRPFAPAAKGALLSAHRSALLSGDRAGAPPRYPLRQSANAPLLDVFKNTTENPLRVVISAIEHESVYEACRELQRKYGAEIVEIPVNGEGVINLKKLQAALNENTVLVSVQMANSEIGAVQPIKEIAKIIRDFRDLRFKIQDSRKVGDRLMHPESCILNPSSYPLFHTDAVQTFQYMECDVRELGVDLLTLSAHKIYGPKGIGALFVRRLMNHESCILNPLITGGGQENNLRSGTENVPAIVGFAKAVEIAEKMRVRESKRVATLRATLWNGIKKIIPDAELNGPPISVAMARLPNNLSIYLPARPAQDVCIELDLIGLAVSPGTACASRAAEPSRVVKALGKGSDRAMSSIRLSLGRQTTMREIRSVLTIFKKRFGK